MRPSDSESSSPGPATVSLRPLPVVFPGRARIVPWRGHDFQGEGVLPQLSLHCPMAPDALRGLQRHNSDTNGYEESGLVQT